MKLSQLQYFVAAAEELNFTRAAARCNVSQPPLSRAIALLEEEIGDRLFERNSHNVSLTKAGESLFADAQRALEAIAQGVERAQLIASGLRGVISIGFGGTPAYWLWPFLVRHFRQQIPDVQIRYLHMPVSDQIDALRDGKIDIGIVRLPVHDELLQTFPVHRESLILARPSGSKEEGHWQKKAVKLSELKRSNFISYARRRGYDYHSDLLAMCNSAGFAPTITQEGQTTESVLGMVACGEGVAIIPADAQRLNIDNVVFCHLDPSEIPEPMLQVEFALAWSDVNRSAAVHEFLAQAKKAIAQRSGHVL